MTQSRRAESNAHIAPRFASGPAVTKYDLKKSISCWRTTSGRAAESQQFVASPTSTKDTIALPSTRATECEVPANTRGARTGAMPWQSSNLCPAYQSADPWELSRRRSGLVKNDKQPLIIGILSCEERSNDDYTTNSENGSSGRKYGNFSSPFDSRVSVLGAVGADLRPYRP
jgi:hypothetical protein